MACSSVPLVCFVETLSEVEVGRGETRGRSPFALRSSREAPFPAVSPSSEFPGRLVSRELFPPDLTSLRRGADGVRSRPRPAEEEASRAPAEELLESVRDRDATAEDAEARDLDREEDDGSVAGVTKEAARVVRRC